MIRRPPRSTRTDTLFPTRRSSDLEGVPVSDEALASWWTRFDDPVLNTLVEQAIDANLDIAQAKARLRKAREALVQSRADYLPSVTGSANAGRDFDSDAKDRSSFGLGADASWEVDLFGGISRSVEAARADEAATYYNLANVRTAIIAEVAINYIRSEEHTSE